MCTITPQVFDVNVGGIWLGREAIVTNVHAGVGHRKSIDIVGIKPIGVFGEGLL